MSILRVVIFVFGLPACAFSASNVVNLSHYDMMRPDFATMKRQGIVGVIHEASYPRFERDAKYLDRQMGRSKPAYCGAHITTVMRLILSARPIIFSALYPMPGRRLIP